MFPLDAELRLEGMGRVVDPSVDDFGITRGCGSAEGGGPLEEEDLVTGYGEGSGGGEADDSCTDHARLDAIM